MKKILVIAIVCLLGSFAAAAQTVKVNGTIVDEQNRPVEFVNVALISLPDSSFVTESTTDGKGKFALRATAGSDFLLRLSYIGYVGEHISTWAQPSISSLTATLLLPSMVTSSPSSPARGPLMTRTCSPGARGEEHTSMASSE